MTRIISGKYGGRKLAVPDSARPTTEMVREALFSTLQSWDAVAGRAVLDLYSGSGGLGFEALSRGAESVVFVESDSKAVEILKKNAANLQAAAKVVKQTAKSFAKSANLAESKFDLVLIDPPYKVANQEILEIIEELVNRDFLQENAILVIERPTRDLFIWPAVIKEIKNKRYGDNTLYYGSVA
jgi:16S rRNA (guanine966-N2)-methyltransferase